MNLKLKTLLILTNLLLTYIVNAQLEIAQDDTSLLKAKYFLLENGVSLGVDVAPRKVYFTGHGGEIEIRDAVESYNHGKKRGNTILVTGDRPVFGMMRVYPEHSNNPDRIKMGDGRFWIHLNGQGLWLDEFEKIRTEFHPSYTKYDLETARFPGISLELTISQADEWGCVVCLEAAGLEKSDDLQVDFHYGGLLRTGNRQSANYFQYDPDDGKGNEIKIEKDYCILDGLAQQVFDKVMIVPGEPCQMNIEHDKVVFTQNLDLKPGTPGICYVIGHAEELSAIKRTLLEANPESLMREAEAYYKTIINSYAILTPCKYLDAGFRNAIVNFEYVWGGLAWLEGVHWWNAPWTNLFQISAGIALDQMEKTQITLQTFNAKGTGPAPMITADGTPTHANPPISEDGLLYYCHQIWQFYQHTGDTAFIKSIWPGLFKSILRMYEVRDPDGDGLLSWREGCNPFLYQADHLGLPNAGASPSIMAAGMIEQISLLGDILGETENARTLKELAKKTNNNLLQLWNTEKGCFYNHIDHQDVKHIVHYYTDLVFPALYSRLDDEYNWQSLNYLRNTLFLNAVLYQPRMNLQLCRVGDFEPFLFSTNNVMPTQMAETARALFKTGDVDNGFKLLKSVAVTGTIYTEAPGNFPEAMDLKGKGEGQFIFGNPIGSFLYSAVDGLFGLRLKNGGKTLNWAPAFPFDWPEAEMTMPYANVNYTMRRTVSGRKLVYQANHVRPRKLAFSTWLKPGEIKEVLVNGKSSKYRLEPGLNTMKISLEADKSSSHTLEITYAESNVKHDGKDLSFAGEKGQIAFSFDLSRISDPQGMFERFSISGKQIQYTSSKKPGTYTAFAYLKNIPVAIPVNMEIVPLYEVHPDTSFYDRKSRQVYLPLKYRVAGDVLSEVTLLNKTVKTKWLKTGLLEKSDMIIIPDQELMPEGNYRFRIAMHQEERVVFDTVFNVNLKGKDATSREEMVQLRDVSTSHIDLSALYNAENPGVWGPWSVDDSTIVLSCLQDDSGIMNTRAGNFRFPVEGPRFMIVQAGRSDRYTQLPQQVPYPEKITVPVQDQGFMLSLFYHSEVKYRHTFAKVGSLTLNYADGTETVIPLVVNKNMKPIYKHAASETIAIKPCSAPRDGMMLNILRIGLENKVLDSFTIHLPIVDAQFGLVAASISGLDPTIK